MQLPPIPELPGVSYVMPVLNEEGYLEEAVHSVLRQEYLGEKELVLALGPSTDGTDAIARALADADPRIVLIPNPERDIPIGLNLAIAASRYPVVIRVDAHSDLTPDYTLLGIAALREHEAANVGGIMRAAGKTPVQEAIAAAYNSPYGLGGGAYHGDGVAGQAESAYLGIFRREAIDAVGGYDPVIRRGEDWELNLRIREVGGLIWFEPRLGVTYWPRSNFRDLSRQFFATGAWRAVITKRHPRQTPWRFYVPGALVLGLAASLIVLILQLVGVVPFAVWSIIHVIPALYAVGVLFAAARLQGIRGIRARLLGCATLITMHVSWGFGFIVGLFGGAKRTIDRSRISAS